VEANVVLVEICIVQPQHQAEVLGIHPEAHYDYRIYRKEARLDGVEIGRSGAVEGLLRH
jgi:hypothetical protein